MQQGKSILILTTDLLANGAFSLLKDDEISALHHFLLRLKEPLTYIQQNLLLTYWQQACCANLPAPLLHRCNTILLHLGRNPIEIQISEMEMY